MTDFQNVVFEPGDLLFEAGAPADKLFIILSGVVEMLDAKSGQAFATLGAGQSFGEQAIVPGGIRGATVRAREQTSCQVITADNLKLLLETQSPMMTPVFEALLLQQSMHNRLRTRAV